MASFDFIDASAKAYDFVFRNFSYLARVSVPVLFLMVLCQLLSILFVQDTSILRNGLILFPANMVMGIYSAALIRFALYNEPIYIWGTPVPVPIKSEKEKKINYFHGSLSPRQSLQGGAVFYALIYVVGMALLGLMEHLAQTVSESEQANPAEVSPQDLEAAQFSSFVMLVPIIIASVWIIKLLFVYVSVSMGVGLSSYMKVMRGMFPSVLLGMTLMICTLPVYTLGLPMMNVALILFKFVPTVIPVIVVVISSVLFLIAQSVLIVASAIGINYMFVNSSSSQ